MELKEIKILLEKYETGESSLAEEKMLRKYFRNHQVPEELKAYQGIFAFSEVEKEKKSTVNGTLPEPVKSYKHLWTGIAASIILLVGIFLFQDDSSEMQDSELGTIQNEEEALQKSMEALKMVSKLMNESKQDLIYLKEFNKTKDKFLKTE
ncbi:hypothetical protein SAMN05444483_101766 [Salegentibacter echinorum]|uniref:Uncharacterized protein n=1 Tax=Salegentibacter echinorum TaxID=1073325 RepID=A0A1M5D1T8_SALEC|nr:hypothetical protein [Salegentibacter echinorum]SHF60978.1 hypothetical protein SAMN05444483_101766 [Salegentibacter echinorum]